MSASSSSNPLIRKLEAIGRLSEEERDAILDLPMTVRELGPDVDVVREGDKPAECCLVLAGFLCRYKLVRDGKRQIMNFYIAGDVPDLQSLHLGVMDTSIGTLARSTVGAIPHESLRAMIHRHPGLGALLWRETLIDAAICREWMVGIGRRSAYQRIAHQLCEMQLRFQAVGLAREDGYDLPITQGEVADSLGLSTVHVNRVLQDLRAEELIILRGGTLTILNWEGLVRAGEFDPAYLHLTNGSSRGAYAALSAKEP